MEKKGVYIGCLENSLDGWKHNSDGWDTPAMIDKLIR